MLPVEPSTAMFFPGWVMGELGKGKSLPKRGISEKVALYEKQAEAATWFLPAGLIAALPTAPIA